MIVLILWTSLIDDRTSIPALDIYVTDIVKRENWRKKRKLID
jgi:hypothetical protein